MTRRLLEGTIRWFVDGRGTFAAIALAIEDEKSERFMCGWWLCPDLYRFDAILEAKAKNSVQGFAAALAVLITGASQSRQHGKSKPESYYLPD
ncbi:phospholipase D zeta 1-like protein isoform X1 [Tanacetum coccineum]